MDVQEWPVEARLVNGLIAYPKISIVVDASAIPLKRLYYRVQLDFDQEKIDCATYEEAKQLCQLPKQSLT